MSRISSIFKLITCSAALLLSINVSARPDRCVKERKAVDYIQERMRNGYSIGEYLRDRERIAKAEYLKCMRDPNVANLLQMKTAELTAKLESKPKRKSTKNIYKRPAVKVKPMGARSSGYHNYKGVKLAAWSKFFSEPEECIALEGDMKLFVKCAKNRKEVKRLFDSRWDDKREVLNSVNLE